MKAIRFILTCIILTGVSGIFFGEQGNLLYSNNKITNNVSHQFCYSPRIKPSSRSKLNADNLLRWFKLPKHLQQAGYEAGIILGTSHSLTNIGTGLPSFMGTHWETSDLNAGIFGRYRINNIFAANASFHYARIHSADSLSPPNTSRYKRGFYFDNQIFELSLSTEIYITYLILGYDTPWEFFGVLGGAVFYHDPNLTVPNPDNYTFEEFSNIEPAILMGLGLSYSVDNNIKIGADLGYRLTFTDYLDGFTRPASEYDDSYFLISLKVSYFFAPKRFLPY